MYLERRKKMKKYLLQGLIMLLSTSLFAQWVPVSNGLPDYPPTTLLPLADTMILSTYGGGIYKTIDNGDNWSNISGNLGNLFVNDIRGFASFVSLMVSTEGGPYISFDQQEYQNCTAEGLTNTDVNYFWWGNENMGGEFMVGTNGGGVFASEEYYGPWFTANTGLSGDGFIINDLGGYSDDDVEYVVMATDGGTYWAVDGATEWTTKNTGLTGDALKVKKLTGLGTLVLIATHGGLYYNYNNADNWEPLIPNEKLTVLFILMTAISPTGIMCFAFGDNGFYSQDILNWTQLDMGGIQGEVTAANANSTHLFVGVTTTAKDGNRESEMYRRPLEQIVTGIDEHAVSFSQIELDQNYPNPFGNVTTISYNINMPGFVSLVVYDFCGRKVKTLINKYQEKGRHSVAVDTGSLANGMYSYMLQLNEKNSLSRKMIIAR
jgi:hypothetical protein